MLSWLFRQNESPSSDGQKCVTTEYIPTEATQIPSDTALVDDVRDVILSFLPSHASLALVNSTWHDRAVFSELYRSRMAKRFPRMVEAVEAEWRTKCEGDGDALAWRTAYLGLHRRIRASVEDTRKTASTTITKKERASRLWASVSSKLSSKRSSMGFLSGIPPYVKRIVVVGLDAAGKTTIQYKAGGEMGLKFPTTYPCITMPWEEVECNNVTLSAMDLGGQSKLRPLLRHYFDGTPAVVFVVDSVDRERFVGEHDSVYYELQWAAGLAETANAIFLILANKQDLPGAATAEELATILDVANLPNQQRWRIQGCCAYTGDGLSEGFEWLGKQLDGA